MLLLNLLERVLIELSVELDLHYDDDDGPTINGTIALLWLSAVVLYHHGRPIPFVVIHTITRFT